MSCFSCVSYTSMHDCIESQTEKVCSEEENRCGKISVSVSGTEAFGKGCLTDAVCQEYQAPGYCEQEFGGECELTCCEDSLCNYD